MSFSFLARRTLPIALVGAVALGLVAWMPAQDGKKPPPPRHEGKEKGEDSPLEHAMQEMNGALKSIGKSGFEAANRDASLEALAKFQHGVVAAKGLVPPMAEKMDAAKRPEFVAGYRKELVSVLEMSCKIETAVLDGKYDDANKLMREGMMHLKKEGHDKYQEEEGHERKK